MNIFPAALTSTTALLGLCIEHFCWDSPFALTTSNVLLLLSFVNVSNTLSRSEACVTRAVEILRGEGKRDLPEQIRDTGRTVAKRNEQLN
jgi:hypothetical protein